MTNSLLAALAAVALPGMACFAQTAQDLGLSEHSSFTFPDGGRDPFLPIGWQKPQEMLPAEVGHAPAAPILKPEMFVVTSISVDRIRLAIINGKPYGEGEMFSIQTQTEDKRVLKVQVLTIQDGSVTLGSGSLRLSCPLRLSLQQPVKKP
ncbi:MAG: hypothetical protein PHQ12_10815 [Chthoniobacteraceae bacterium]|nr:hypothetical protein [Chthoniobacteraceae bacterium]